MGNIWEKVILILAGNLKSGRSYTVTAANLIKENRLAYLLFSFEQT